MAQSEFDKVMDEFKRGELFSSDGEKVTNRRKALAIAFFEDREAKDVKMAQIIRSGNRGIRG